MKKPLFQLDSKKETWPETCEEAKVSGLWGGACLRHLAEIIALLLDITSH